MSMLWKPVYFFDSDDATGGTGGTTPPAKTEGTPAGTPPATPPTGGALPGDDAGGEKPINMTSAQLSDRLERAKGTERTALLKALGFDSVEAAQKALKTAEDLRKAQMTEDERRQAELDAIKAQAATFQAELEKAKQESRSLTIQNAAIAQMAGRFVNPGKAFKLLDLSSVDIASDGRVTGIEEAVNALAASDPWTLTPTQPQQTMTQPRGSQTPRQIVAPPAGTPPADNDDSRRVRYFGGGGGGFFEPKEDGVKGSS